MSIQEIKSATRDGESIETSLAAQLAKLIEKTTKDGKPFLRIELSDSSGNAEFNVWSDHPAFEQLVGNGVGSWIEVAGVWQSSQYGLEPKNWQLRLLNQEEIEDLLAGGGEQSAKVCEDYEEIESLVSTIDDPRLRSLSELFLEKYGERFQRTAAAREYHHARRGGLVEHVAQMMRSTQALCQLYPSLNVDLILTGALFHDSGKLWENSYREYSFEMPYTETAELLGHIPVGIELVNRLWQELPHEQWQETQPDSEKVRLHLLHLIASHHGLLEFGSPVTPKTPEAMLLHHIDNIDAKFEMYARGYNESGKLSSSIYDWTKPIGRIVEPLLPPDNT